MVSVSRVIFAILLCLRDQFFEWRFIRRFKRLTLIFVLGWEGIGAEGKIFQKSEVGGWL